MKRVELAAYIRYKTRTNATTFPDLDMLPLVQVRADELSRKLMAGLSGDEDTFLTPHTGNLALNTREYPEPSDILARIKRVEAKLDGTNWIRVVSFSMNEYQGTMDETTIQNNFNNMQFDKVGNPAGARYFIRRKAVYILSGVITAVVDGYKLWCFNYPATIPDLTSDAALEDDPSATTHGFPRELHELLARGVIIDYKESREKPIPLNQTEQSYDKDVAAAIMTLNHGDLGKETIASLPPASERGNNGFNY